MYTQYNIDQYRYVLYICNFTLLHTIYKVCRLLWPTSMTWVSHDTTYHSVHFINHAIGSSDSEIILTETTSRCTDGTKYYWIAYNIASNKFARQNIRW